MSRTLTSAPQPSAETKSSKYRYLVFLSLVALVVSLGSLGLYLVNRNTAINNAKAELKLAEHTRDWANVLLWATKWTELSPTNPDAWLQRANAAKQLSKWDELIDCLEQVPAGHANYFEANALAADTLISELNNVEKAERILSQLYEVFPNKPYVVQRLTYLYSMTQQRTKLSKLLGEAIEREVEPREAYFYLFSQHELFFTNGLLKNTIWEQKTPDFEPLVVSKAIYLARANPTEASNLFGDDLQVPGDVSQVKKLLEDRYPHNEELICYLIELEVDNGNVEEVKRLSSRFRVEHQRLSRYWRYQGWLADNEGDVQKSIDAYRKSLEIDPLDWSTHLEIGNVYRAAGQLPQAEKELEIAIRGKQLSRALMELPSIYEANEEQMQDLLKYIEDCGATNIAAAYRQRLKLLAKSQE
jgi:tetratricopeptide (TPR) repeat protein